MKNCIYRTLFLIALLLPILGMSDLLVGVGQANITPPKESPSAGYTERKGEGMKGTHDPLLAHALFIDNGNKKIALCSVDHLGFTYEMVQEVARIVHAATGLSDCEIYIGSSHTHSGGGGFLNIPVLGEALAGHYHFNLVERYVHGAANAIIEASQHPVPAKIGIGYGKAEGLNYYRAKWPQNITPLSDVTVIKVTHADGKPLAVFFNYAVHPTVLDSRNNLFSADFVGYARTHLKSLLGKDIQPIYFNGAQGDINPVIQNPEDRFESCEFLGTSLAEKVANIWNTIEVKDTMHIGTQKETYEFVPQATPQGLSLPNVKKYKSEMNVLVLGYKHAFITIPGELSCIYDQRLKNQGKQWGFEQVSILGLVNDAHGYIILPEAWRNKTAESALSFGGENYGTLIEEKALGLLELEIPISIKR